MWIVRRRRTSPENRSVFVVKQPLLMHDRIFLRLSRFLHGRDGAFERDKHSTDRLGEIGQSKVGGGELKWITYAS